MTAAAILLAGGESRRMGSPKPLLLWHGVTLVEYQIAELASAGCSPVIAVLGHGAAEVLPLVERAGGRPVINEDYRDGRSSSLRLGAAAVPDGTQAVVVLNVDQPRPAAVTRRLLAEHESQGGLITLPAHAGRRGHPVVLGGPLLEELRRVQEETQGLRGLIRAHEQDVREVEFESAVVLLEMNTPDDYERAKVKYRELQPL